MLGGNRRKRHVLLYSFQVELLAQDNGWWGLCDGWQVRGPGSEHQVRFLTRESADQVWPNVCPEHLRAHINLAFAELLFNMRLPIRHTFPVDSEPLAYIFSHDFWLTLHVMLLAFSHQLLFLEFLLQVRLASDASPCE